MRQPKSGRAGGRKAFCTGTLPPALWLQLPVDDELLPGCSRTGYNNGAQGHRKGEQVARSLSSRLNGDFDHLARAHVVKDLLQIFQWPVGAHQQFKRHSTAGQQ